MTIRFEATARALLADGYSIRFQAAGDSMYPAIRSGELIEVSPIGGRDVLQAGDVVLFKADRGLTAHRVVHVANGLVVTRGDNAVGNDPAVPLDALLGTVTAIERDGVLHRLARGTRSTTRASAALRMIRRRLSGRFAAVSGNTSRVRQYRESVKSY
ncbi:MAG: Peptidase conserved region [Acidobacteria bacterium]|nr:Peptidase conserved region [Acidobacteriota bacterium]